MYRVIFLCLLHVNVSCYFVLSPTCVMLFYSVLYMYMYCANLFCPIDLNVHL